MTVVISEVFAEAALPELPTIKAEDVQAMAVLTMRTAL